MTLKSRILTLLLSTLMCASLFLSASIPAQAAGTASFSLMTFNVKNDNLNFSDIKSMLETQRPAVLGLQEVTNLTWSSINSRVTSLGYTAVRGSYRGTSSIFEGNECNPIFFMTDLFTLHNSGTFWLSDTPETKSKFDESSYYRICTWAVLEAKSTGDKFIVFNTHLDLNETARFKQVKVLLEQINAIEQNAPSAADNLIIMGDMNFRTANSMFRYLTGTGTHGGETNTISGTRFSSTRSIATTVTNNSFGNYYTNPASNPTGDIDHVFVSTEGVACSRHIVTNDAAGSDHLPVRVTLNLIP